MTYFTGVSQKIFPYEVFATLGFFFRVQSTIYRPGGAFPGKRFRFQFFSEPYGTVPTITSRIIFPNEVFANLGFFFESGARYIGLKELFRKSDIVHNFF